MKKTFSIFSIFLFVCLLAHTTVAQVRLPKLIANGMVLQRNTAVNVWGWAAAGEKVTIDFLDNHRQTTANEKGEWMITLNNLSAGGPYTLTVSGSNTIQLNDIWVGDVWLCSGQSNMELPIRRVFPKYEQELTGYENLQIRQFAVAQKYNFHEPQTDLAWGVWKPATKENLMEFSAVAFFFAKDLFDKYQVPIGLINCSLGGSPAEAWLSEEALKQFPLHYNELQRFKNDNLITQIESADNQRSADWYQRLSKSDLGRADANNPWQNPNLNTADWATMQLPGYWASTPMGPVNGVVWFRKEVDVPESMVGQTAKLNLGRIVDADSVWVNGQFVGSVSYQYPPRWYTVPANVLKQGKNVIVVRVISNSGKGGFVPDKTYELSANNQRIDLTGTWQYKLGATMEPLGGQTFVRWKPAGLHNAMLAPLLNVSLKGVIWYQGESNAGRPDEYRTLFPALINNWRDEFKQPQLPFLFVQLANFMEPSAQPAESDWAKLREAQAQALSVPQTGMAVICDVGEWNDIHPLNKKEVGKRLSLSAQKIAYGENNVVFSGPTLKAYKIKGDKIELEFENVGSGLMAKGNSPLNHFAIAGADKQFVWAKAKIKGRKVLVSCSSVAHPVAVRYAWADNPQGANLYNKEGLPASPFRTDKW